MCGNVWRYVTVLPGPRTVPMGREEGDRQEGGHPLTAGAHTSLPPFPGLSFRGHCGLLRKDAVGYPQIWCGWGGFLRYLGLRGAPKLVMEALGLVEGKEKTGHRRMGRRGNRSNNDTTARASPGLHTPGTHQAGGFPWTPHSPQQPNGGVC